MSSMNGEGGRIQTANTESQFIQELN